MFIYVLNLTSSSFTHQFDRKVARILHLRSDAARRGIHTTFQLAKLVYPKSPIFPNNTVPKSFKHILNILSLTGSSLSIDQHSGGVANPTVWSMPKVGGAYPEMMTQSVPGIRSSGTLERSTSAMSGRIAVPLLQSSPSLKRPSSAGVYMTSPELTERRQVQRMSHTRSKHLKHFAKMVHDYTPCVIPSVMIFC